MFRFDSLSELPTPNATPFLIDVGLRNVTDGFGGITFQEDCFRADISSTYSFWSRTVLF
jgi:hypothetical protein